MAPESLELPPAGFAFDAASHWGPENWNQLSEELRQYMEGSYAQRMRDIDTIDGELRLLARARHVARELTGRTPSTAHLDELLDERSATMTVAGVY